jgi:hemerythrin
MTQTISVDRMLLSVPQMDDEHSALISQANAYAAALEAGASRTEIELRLTQLSEAFQAHFAAEEDLMRSNSFPGLAPHEDEHRRLMEQVTGLRDSVASGNVQICDALALFVRLWTEQHIAGLDAAFAQFLNGGKARCGSGLVSIAQ